MTEPSNDATNSTAVPTFMEYVAVLRRRWWAILIVVAACAGGAFAWEDRKPRLYSAEAEVQFTATPGLGRENDYFPTPTDLKFANSDPVIQPLYERLGYSPSVNTTGDDKAQVMVFEATDPDPIRAADAANTYADVFQDKAAERDAQNLTNAIAELDKKIQETKDDLQSLQGATDPQSLQQQLSLDGQRSRFEEQRATLQILARTNRGGTITVLSEATPPAAPISPDPPRKAATGVVVGFILAAAGIVLIDRLDRRIRHRDHLEQLDPSVPVLGLIPRDNRHAGAMLVQFRDQGKTSEAFRSLRTSLQFLGLERPIRSVQITSPDAAEGKTTVAAYLALAYAQAGAPVVLVDVDLRHPMQHTRFGMDNEVGLSSVILRRATLRDVMRQVADCPNLFVIPSGPTPGNPADFLWPSGKAPGAATVPVIVESLVSAGYLVVLDCPPVLPVADALTVSRSVDSTVLVVSEGETDTGRIRRALKQLGQVNANVAGFVLNNVASEGNGQSYGYRYGTTPKRAVPATPVPALTPAVPKLVSNGHREPVPAASTVIDLTGTSPAPTMPAPNDTEAKAPQAPSATGGGRAIPQLPDGADLGSDVDLLRSHLRRHMGLEPSHGHDPSGGNGNHDNDDS